MIHQGNRFEGSGFWSWRSATLQRCGWVTIQLMASDRTFFYGGRTVAKKKAAKKAAPKKKAAKKAAKKVAKKK